MSVTRDVVVTQPTDQETSSDNGGLRNQSPVILGAAHLDQVVPLNMGELPVCEASLPRRRTSLHPEGFGGVAAGLRGSGRVKRRQNSNSEGPRVCRLSPLEGNGFEPSVPRCARTADSVAVV